jgi:hypothetical protein
MPRALSRLSLNRGGPRDLGAIRDGLEAAGRHRGAVGDGACRSIWRSRVHALSRQPGEMTGTPRGRSTTSAAAEARRRLRAWRPSRRTRRDAGAARPVAQGDRRAADVAMPRKPGVRSLKIKYNNVLGYFIEVTQQNADALTGTTRPRPSSFTGRPWPTPCGSRPRNWRISKAASPMPPTGRWRSSLQPFDELVPDRGRRRDRNQGGAARCR